VYFALIVSLFFFFFWLVAIFVQNPWLLLLICEMGILELICVCRGPFFQSTADQVQHLSNLPGVQGPSSPVVHGSQNVKRNGLKPSTKSKTQKKEGSPAHLFTKLKSARTTPKDSKVIQKRRGKMVVLEKPFFPPLLAWCSRR
jgi:ABC-type bacteriocin/lantibiotic exporter with double-glycine peptidase domain